MAWTKEQATKYKNDFIKETYDRVNLTLPKGKKALVTEHAKSQGMSLNAYINKLIADDMGAALTASNKQQGD